MPGAELGNLTEIGWWERTPVTPRSHDAQPRPFFAPRGTTTSHHLNNDTRHSLVLPLVLSFLCAATRNTGAHDIVHARLAPKNYCQHTPANETKQQPVRENTRYLIPGTEYLIDGRPTTTTAALLAEGNTRQPQMTQESAITHPLARYVTL